MNMPLRNLIIMAVAATAMSIVGSIARAGETSDTIAIKFGGNAPPAFGGSMMNPDDLAGVPGVETKNWNNAVPIAPPVLDLTVSADANEYRAGFANLGTLSSLVRDTNGVATTTGASVSWSAERTWCSSSFDTAPAENNNFPGDNTNPSPNRKLMLGTLDMQAGNGPPNTDRVHTNRVTITGLPDDMATGYDVIIYILGGVGNGRGGTYTVNGVKQLSLSGDIALGTAGPDFVKGPGDGSATGNYLRFTGLSGPTVKIRVSNESFTPSGGSPMGGYRGHLNAVEIIKMP
jgi:hypothetical protein